MRCDKKDLLLYGVTDRSWLGDRTLAQQVEASLRGGATMIQLREKHMDRGSILAQALELRELCGRYGVPASDFDRALEMFNQTNPALAGSE